MDVTNLRRDSDSLGIVGPLHGKVVQSGLSIGEGIAVNKVTTNQGACTTFASLAMNGNGVLRVFPQKLSGIFTKIFYFLKLRRVVIVKREPYRSTVKFFVS